MSAWEYTAPFTYFVITLASVALLYQISNIFIGIFSQYKELEAPIPMEMKWCAAFWPPAILTSCFLGQILVLRGIFTFRDIDLFSSTYSTALHYLLLPQIIGYVFFFSQIYKELLRRF